MELTEYKQQLGLMRKCLNKYLALPGKDKGYMKAMLKVVDDNLELEKYDEYEFMRLLGFVARLEDTVAELKFIFLFRGPMRDMATKCLSKQN